MNNIDVTTLVDYDKLTSSQLTIILKAHSFYQKTLAGKLKTLYSKNNDHQVFGWGQPNPEDCKCPYPRKCSKCKQHFSLFTKATPPQADLSFLDQ